MIGFSGSDYGYLHSDDLDSVDAFFMTGCSASIAANRVSYFYDFRGPSLAIDTACSSALIAFHLACESVRSRRQRRRGDRRGQPAPAPAAVRRFSKASMLSPKAAPARRSTPRATATCARKAARSWCSSAWRPRSPTATGSTRVVAGTGVNCDGRTNGLTRAERRRAGALLREVYGAPASSPADIDYVEAHGTGTAVGDPIEAHALGRGARPRTAGRPAAAHRLGQDQRRPPGNRRGHGGPGEGDLLPAASRRAALAALRYAQSAHSVRRAESGGRARAAAARRPDKRLVIGVNSFGFGGANGHAILESAPSAARRALRRRRRSPRPCCVSGASEAALRAAAQAMADWLLRQRGRRALRHRPRRRLSTATGTRTAPSCSPRTARSAAEQLADFARRSDRAEAVATGRALERAGKPVFVYSAATARNGRAWAAGCSTRIRCSASRSSAWTRCCARHPDFRSCEALRAEDLEQRLSATEVAQPLLFAIQVGHYRMPARVGHARPRRRSATASGEIAAAWACGALSLEDAARIVFTAAPGREERAARRHDGGARRRRRNCASG